MVEEILNESDKNVVNQLRLRDRIVKDITNLMKDDLKKEELRIKTCELIEKAIQEHGTSLTYKINQFQQNIISNRCITQQTLNIDVMYKNCTFINCVNRGSLLVGEETIWSKGTWLNGIWKGGVWQSGYWVDGEWQNGTWLNGIWQNGEWNNGIWKDGIWINGIWQNGQWYDGVWKDGYWKFGTWNNGYWNKGTWLHGYWNDGTWNSGRWLNGVWNDGVWNSGRWIYGIWKDKNSIHPNQR